MQAERLKEIDDYLTQGYMGDLQGIAGELYDEVVRLQAEHDAWKRCAHYWCVECSQLLEERDRLRAQINKLVFRDPPSFMSRLCYLFGGRLHE